MAARIANYRLFLKEFRRTFHTTGAILPSSPRLAVALSRFVAEQEDEPPREQDGQENGPSSARDRCQPRRILEVGPGTGAVTARILPRMGMSDRLDMVELNDEFVAHLRDRFDHEPNFRSVAARAQIIHSSLLDLPAEATYDRIISGLPLNNFASAEVRELLAATQSLLRPGGVLSFFQYIAVRPLRGIVSKKQERQRLREIGKILGDLFADHEIRRDAVMLNVPPAWVHHVRFG